MDYLGGLPKVATNRTSDSSSVIVGCTTQVADSILDSSVIGGLCRRDRLLIGDLCAPGLLRVRAGP